MKPGSLTSLTAAVTALPLLSGLILAAIALSTALLQRSFDDKLLEDVDRLARLRAVVAFEPNLARIEQTHASGQHDGLFMTGGTAAELSARLQSRVNDAAGRMGIQVLRSGDIPTTRRDGLALIGAEVELLGPANAIYAMLGEIEQSAPAIVVERLAIRAPPGHVQETGIEQPVSVSVRILAAVRTRGNRGPVQ